MKLVKCPDCTIKYFGRLPPRMLSFYDEDDPITYGLSRRMPIRICTTCAKAEAMADATGLTDGMARTVVGNDQQEALRMPEGGFFGTMMKFPTGGLDEYHEKWQKVYGKSKMPRAS